MIQTWEDMGGREVDQDPGYTALCSRLTLYSEREGFFREVATGVMTEVAEKTAAASTLGIGQAFSSLRTDEHRVRYVAALDSVSSLEPPALYRSKSAKESYARREEGNAALKTGDLKKALLLYSASVMRAPGQGQDMTLDEGLSLAYAYANRSAVLLQMNRPDLASRDATLAIDSGYPAAKRHVLLERKGKSEEARGRLADALSAYQEALKCLGKKERGGEAGKSVQKAIERCTKGIKEGNKRKEKIYKEKNDLPPLTGGPSDLFPNASKAVGVAEGVTEPGADGKGRFAVAMTDISAGDNLVTEAPFACVLLPEKAGTHCHHCFVRLFAPVPCSRCSGVAFCDIECRDAAESTYHPFECSVGSTLMASGLSVLSRLALRLVTRAPLKLQVEALEDHMEDPHPEKLWTKGEDDVKQTRAITASENKTDSKKCPGGSKRYYDASDYRAILNLLTLSEQRSPIDMLERTLMAVFLIKCLRHTSFFKSVSCKDMEGSIGLRSEEEVYTGRLLLHNLQMLQFNAHEVFETLYERECRFKGSKTQYLGVGIYPTVALFNHDCYPAVTRFFVGTKMVVRALRPLKAGEAIPENYGPVFTKQTRRERRRSLRSRYWFLCQCCACVGDWPTYDGMAETAPLMLRCPKESCWNAIKVEAEILEEREQILGRKDTENKIIEEIADDEAKDGGTAKSGKNKKRRSKKSKGVKCEKCGGVSNITTQLDRVVHLKSAYEEGLSAMERAGIDGNRNCVDKAARLFCKSIEGWSECICPPYRHLLLAQDSLRLCINSQGNKHVPDTEPSKETKQTEVK